VKYRVPRFALRAKVKSHPVDAWETGVPGLIIHKWLEDNGFALTHRNSGFIVKNALERSELETLSNRFVKLPIDWTVKEPWKIHAQVARLTKIQIQEFTNIMFGKPTSRPLKYRNKIAKKAGKRQFMAWWKTTR
jgi:hypothetical protein